MDNTISKDGSQFAGDIEIKDITLICSNGTQIDLKSFLIELNLHEDIFSSTIYGNILLTDSINIIEKGPCIGEEYIRVNVDTPGLNIPISKTFRVYSISDRQIVLDDKTQGFIIHFCSPELFVDGLGKIYKTFNGKISDVAGDIYQNYLQTARNINVNADGNLQESDDSTNLTITDETENSATFTSPGWGPVKCLTWLAAKSYSAKYKSADFLFFESCQQFYFGSISSIIDGYKQASMIAGDFYYKQSNIRDTNKGKIALSGVQYTPPSIAREYGIVEDFRIVESFNTLKNTNEGQYASQLIDIDLTTKKFKYNNFDYVSQFKNYTHLAPNSTFTDKQFRNAQSFVIPNIKQSGLYSNTKNNVNEYVKYVKQNRISLLKGFTNTIIEISVPGRTNFEAGSVIYFSMPKLGPKSEEDKSKQEQDEFYSGLYLVTCLRHRIFGNNTHRITMECARDSTDVAYN